MTDASTTLASPQPLAWSPPPSEERGRAIVLWATDGTAGSDGALRVADALARATGATLELLTVVQMETVLHRDAVNGGGETLLATRGVRRSVVEQQIARVLGQEPPYALSVIDGNPAYTISRVAIERRASMVVVGLGRHFIAHRLFGDETALQLARISRVPVMAVPANAVGAPRRAVVAIDFSDIATRAAHAAIETIDAGGTIDLVHVMPHVHEAAFTVEPEEPYQRLAEAQLAIVAAQLVVPDGVAVNCVVQRGRPAPALLDYATRVGADVICTGTHGRGFVARALTGSVTTKLLRGSTCTVLAMPRDPLPSCQPTCDRAATRPPD